MPDTATPASRIGAAIREARDKAGLSQDDVARAMAMHRVTIARWEIGERSPGIADLVRLANALKIPPLRLAKRILEKIQGGD